MTSAREAAATPPLPEERRRAALEQLPPPAHCNKPLTPFGIEDILARPSPPAHGAPPARIPEKAAGPAPPRTAPSSPLCALEELASKTFRGLELSALRAAEGTGGARGRCAPAGGGRRPGAGRGAGALCCPPGAGKSGSGRPGTGADGAP